jgi:hypothetical protein
MLFPDLLKETDDGAARRLACKEMRDLLLQALEIVNEVSGPLLLLSPIFVSGPRLQCVRSLVWATHRRAGRIKCGDLVELS